MESQRRANRQLMNGTAEEVPETKQSKPRELAAEEPERKQWRKQQ